MNKVAVGAAALCVGIALSWTAPLRADRLPSRAQASPDRALFDKRAQKAGLGVVAVHERLHQEAVLFFRHVKRALDLVLVPAEGLLTEDVLAGLERGDRPPDVERVRQRDGRNIPLPAGRCRT